MEAEGPNINTLEGCKFAGDLQTKKIKEKAILIVGDTRVGKSTIFNYAIGVPMVGVQTQDFDIQLKPFYQPGAEIKFSLQSVTLVPNIETVVINEEEVGVADMAGFSDEARGYVGTYGVSYMLEQIFSRVKEFKIILVASAPKFEMDQVGEIISPFANLTSLFRGQTLLNASHKKTLQRLIDSIAIVVAKSTKSQKFYLAKLKRVIDFLTEEQKKTNATTQRKIILRILESIHKNNRIELFKKADSESQLSKCKILQNLSQPNKKWNYYDFKNDLLLKKQSIIELPFKKQYQKMCQKLPNQKIQYINSGKAKKENMKATYKILTAFVEKGIQNWHSQKIDYTPEFQALENLISNHPYGSIDLMLSQLKEQVELDDYTERVVTRLDLIEQFEKISKLNEEVQKGYFNSLKVIDKIQGMKQPIRSILNICRKIFCQNAQQEKKFLIFMFINLRNLEQTSMQSKIDENACADIPNIVSDSTKSILPKPITELKAQFFKAFKAKKIQSERFIKILNDMTGNSQLKDTEAKDFHLIQTNNGIQVGNRFFKKNKTKEALQKYLKSNDELQKYLSFYLGQDEDKQQLQIYQFKQRQIFKKIGLCLQKLNYFGLALRLYEHGKFVNLTMACHKKCILAANSKKNKYIAMQEYIKALKKFGKKSQAIQVYEQMLDQFECFPQNRKKLKSELVGLLQTKSSQESNDYIQLLQDQQTIQNNQSLLKQIESKLLLNDQEYDYENDGEDNQKEESKQESEESADQIEPDADDEAFEIRKQMVDNEDMLEND